MKHTLVNARVRVEMKIVASVLFISVYQTVGCGVEASCVDSYCDVFVQLSDRCSFFFSIFQDLFSISAYVYAQKPQLDIHSFEGTFTRVR